MARRRKKQQSIHPRVVRNRTRYKKVNTASHPTGDRQRRSIKSLRGHLEDHPYDKQSANHLAKLEENWT